MMLTDRAGGPDDIPPDWTRVGPLVAYQYVPDSHLGNGGLIIWHWCDHRLWAGRSHFDEHPEEYPPGWAAAGATLHHLVSADPLHLEPSLLWADCCGLHGFIRDGHWIGA